MLNGLSLHSNNDCADNPSHMTVMDRSPCLPTAFRFVYRVPEPLRLWRYQHTSPPYTTQPKVRSPHSSHQRPSSERSNKQPFSSFSLSSWARLRNARSIDWLVVYRHGFSQGTSPTTSTGDSTHCTNPQPIGDLSDAFAEGFGGGCSASPSSTMKLSLQTGQPTEIVHKDAEESDRFIRLGFLMTEDLQKKPILIAMDTMAEVSIMRKGIFDKLGLPLHRFSMTIVPLQTRSAQTTIRPLGLVRHVDWHFARAPQTYTTDFLVVDTDQYDILIGEREIKRYHLLHLGADIPNVVVRHLSKHG
ncbi:hypothetical protein BO83DRAFT_463332 [Aspergillus eucalypticola CBS 122712]|uniref:Uncharacterized protein n=1 Tax=Aspergillus eucalypticola (strain CBS 122712 / IBT 29274) TaxID=1448314 RepID=A0A317VP49_ASPEC|nr:uncharacterized protein BO83DRAFT_463332 [Aspergillus eucalypticola CBS 122712]PWY75685.1 hypothetical protein BO83DRAFT_463332 [Aspergillus eucalypticola CBS 122712]